MGELYHLMVKVAQVQRGLSRWHRWREVWSGADKVTSWLELDELVVDEERQRQMRRKELSVLRMNGHVEVHTLYIQAEHEVLRPDDELEHAKIFVGRLTLDRCLVEAAEGMHDALLALAGGRMNSGSGEEVFAPRSKVLIRSDPSALEKILNREIYILRVDEFRRRGFWRKGTTLLFLPSSCDLGLPLIGFIRITETLRKN